MKRIILTTSIFLLSGCITLQQAPYQAAAQCDPIGIDINAPDFYQKHDQTSTDRFYDCMKAQFTKMPIFDDTMNGNSGKNNLLIRLDYQKNLWRQVFTREKTPGTAQEAWMQWQQNERAINAANNVAASQAAAAQAAQNGANNSYSQPAMTCMSMGSAMMQCQ